MKPDIDMVRLVHIGNTKTTVEITDALLAEARKAQREGTTIRNLVEEGLRHLLGERGERGGFQRRKVTFAGEGLNPDLDGALWDEIRRRVYERCVA